MSVVVEEDKGMDENFINNIIERLINSELNNLDEFTETNLKLNVVIKLITNFLTKNEEITVYLNTLFNLLTIFLNNAENKEDDYLFNESISLTVTYLFYYNLTDIDRLALAVTKFLNFFETNDFNLNSESIFLFKQFYKKIDVININSLLAKNDIFFIEKLRFLQNILIMKYNDNFALHQNQFTNSNNVNTAKKIHLLISSINKNKDDFILNYESSIKILEAPIHIFRFLIEDRHYSFRSLDSIIQKTIDLFKELMIKNDAVTQIRPLENQLNLAISNSNFKMKLQDFGVNIHNFLQNTDDSSDEDIQLLYEPLSKISFPEHKKSLANLSTVDATLINNKAYLKLLFTNFFIKHKRFIRYMQDLNLFESHFDIYFHRKKDIKNEIISSVKFGDLNQWRNWLINQEYRMIEFMDNQNLNKNLEYLIKNTSFGEIFNTITYEIKRTTQQSIPEVTISDKVVNEDDIFNGISFGETSVNIDLVALNNKIDDYLNMTISSPEDKTQDDWCAYNVLFKYSTSKEVNFLLSEQVFKKTNIKEFFQKIYFSNKDYEYYEEQINLKINDIKNKIDIKDEKIQKLKEENERYARILASSDLTDPLEQETSEKDTSQEPTNKVDDEFNEQDDVDMEEEQENDKEESTDLPNDNETNEDNKNENIEHKDRNSENEAIKNEPHECLPTNES